MLGEQTVRQQARVRARQMRAKVRQEQAQRQRRLSKWGEQVAVSLAERDALVAECERQAGEALRSMIDGEGLTATEALTWCGTEGLTARETGRLMRGISDQHDDLGQASACECSAVEGIEVEGPRGECPAPGGGHPHQRGC